MSIVSSISQVVVSYITAMHAWEVQSAQRGGCREDAAGDCGLSIMDLVGRLQKCLDSGEADLIEADRQRIITEYCTPRKRCSRGSWGTTPKHHPQLELITRVQQIDKVHAHVWTDFTDEGQITFQRRYELQCCDGMWLIDQHYILCDGEQISEIY